MWRNGSQIKTAAAACHNSHLLCCIGSTASHLSHLFLLPFGLTADAFPSKPTFQGKEGPFAPFGRFGFLADVTLASLAAAPAPPATKPTNVRTSSSIVPKVITAAAVAKQRHYPPPLQLAHRSIYSKLVITARPVRYLSTAGHNEGRHISRIFGGRSLANAAGAAAASCSLLFPWHHRPAAALYHPHHQQWCSGGLDPLPRGAIPDLLRTSAARWVRLALPSERTCGLRHVESEHHDRSDRSLVHGGGGGGG